MAFCIINYTDENSCDTPLEVYKTVQGNNERDHYNQRQIDVIVKEILPKLNEIQFWIYYIALIQKN